MSSKRHSVENFENQENIQDIELVNIEDIVPAGANSLFLSFSRALIYMSNKNTIFTNALKTCCGISSNDLKSDIHLQNLLRVKLCEYFCENGIVKDKSSNHIYLKEEYSKYFYGNIYDFLIQVYQLSINNFSNNTLFRKYALCTLCQILKIKISYKKSNGQWKIYEPQLAKSNKSVDDDNKKQFVHYLNNCTIYLQEFRTDSSSHSSCKKTVRFLLDKRLWLKNYQDNSKICLNFSQFNDANELKTYNKLSYSIGCKQIMKPFGVINGLNSTQTAFCVFIACIPIQVITSIGFNNQTKNSNHEMDLVDDFNTVGKQIIRFESIGIEKLRDYFNFLYGKVIFTDEFIKSKYNQIINQ